MIRSILALALAAAVVVGAIWALVHFVGLQASIIWTGLVGLVAWAIQTAVQQRQEYRRLLAEQKRQQYFELLDFLNQSSGVSSENSEEDQDPERLRQLRRWSLRLTMIGSDEVVKAWNHARTAPPPNEAPQDEGERIQHAAKILLPWGNLWLAMRRDCGHLDTKLTVTDMLASFVNDVESYRSLLEPPKQKGPAID